MDSEARPSVGHHPVLNFSLLVLYGELVLGVVGGTNLESNIPNTQVLAGEFGGHLFRFLGLELDLLEAAELADRSVVLGAGRELKVKLGHGLVLDFAGVLDGDGNLVNGL